MRHTPRHARTAAALFLVALLSVAVSGQYHSAGYLTASTRVELTTQVGSVGSVQTLWDNPAAVNGLAMDTDNRRVICGDGSSAFGIHGLLAIDPATLAVTTIIQNGNLLYGPLDLAVNGDGDYVFTNRYAEPIAPTFTRYGIGLFKYSPATKKLSTITTTVRLGRPGNWSGGLAIDIDSGDYVVQDREWSAGAPLLRINDTGSIATLASGLDPRYTITQDLRTGDWYSPAGSQIWVVKPNSSKPTSLFTPGGGGGWHSAIAFDRASAAAPRIVSRDGRALYFIDPATGLVTTTALSSSSGTPWAITFYRGRNLCSVQTAPGQYTLRLSFPDEGGKGYLMAMSLTGVRPGIALPDGRTIPLAADAFTTLSLLGLMGSAWSRGPLVLDGSGEAAGALDVTGLPVSGVRCWIAALVVEKGIVGTVADPIVIKL